MTIVLELDSQFVLKKKLHASIAKSKPYRKYEYKYNCYSKFQNAKNLFSWTFIPPPPPG